MMQYRYSHRVAGGWDEGDWQIGLHDCRADRASLKEDVFSLGFRDGIWVQQRQADGGRRLFSTGEAWIDFPLAYRTGWGVSACLFTEEGETARRREYGGAELVKWLEEGAGAELEFLYEYTGYQRFLFDCWLWCPEPPCHRECQLLILAEQMACRWNEMQEVEG